MPLQRRLPKVGFTSRKSSTTAQIRLDVLNHIEADVIDLLALKSAGAVPENTLRVKVINSGELTAKVNLKGIVATAGALKAIEAAGGKVEE
jgi:large subunit ribosomal protein L15